MTDGQLWVFAYGSLLWDPGFEVAERQIAVLADHHRSFCMWSIHHRGTVQDPGLVLALDRAQGTRCTGLALRVPAGNEDDTLAYLRERELISAAYTEEICAVTLEGGPAVRAVTYVIDPGHVQYCGDLPLERQAQVIATSVGGRGPNHEYLSRTYSQLQALGIDDPDMAWLERRVAELTKGAGQH
ncbi:gamma-glutamylcyclotransferase [Litoreibacter roseus]|uniref:glutathione-specific gamma-glutamylcyclotransferase n=1 Tax=Litoreibacter roseus TaxID=2601869 RepID=A0A6N6JH26_9RHOB|nr:gamma-glutamylcyclotransferase [Litoreibacter roseus]GFE65267.1 gamma-glutamylcyclotransferase [Litoreibacter roseus]